MATKNLGRVTGLSAYEIWLEQGNTGTEQDFLDSLKSSETGNIWIGSETQYETGINNGTITSQTICFITDEDTEETTVVQDGNELYVYSGVTVTQNGNELEVI